jgi:hypothetical protein
MSEKASQVIPMDFEDDPKVKALEMMGPDGTLEEFSELLSLTGECGSGRFSGFFIVDLSSDDVDDTGARKEYTWTKEVKKLSEKGFQELSDLLQKGEYDSKPKAIDSCKAFLNGLEKHGIQGSLLPVLQGNLLKDKSRIASQEKVEPVVNLLVPKKKRPNPQEPVTVNNVSSLVKKKKF